MCMAELQALDADLWVPNVFDVCNCLGGEGDQGVPPTNYKTQAFHNIPQPGSTLCLFVVQITVSLGIFHGFLSHSSQV